MTLSPAQLEAAAHALRAAVNGDYLAPLRETYPDMQGEDAYAVQARVTQLRLGEGRRIVGRKIGLTSAAVQKQLGVDQPDFGSLFDDMSYGDGEPIAMQQLQQPKIEAEIAMVLGRDVPGEYPGHAQVLSAIDYVLPALEVVGSRIANWNIRLVDTVADNASAGVFVLGGTPVRLVEKDLRLTGMALFKEGEPVATGAGAACLGHPLNAVVWLARTMARLGSPLRAGEVVLSGALGPMITVSAGDVFEARLAGLGSVRAVFAA